MQIRPIRTAQDHRKAVSRIEQLMDATPGTPAADELDILATLVDAYETKHHPVDAPTPLTAILFRMEQQGMVRKDLEPWIGSRARVSEVLGNKRGLTLTMIRRLREGLGISADLLIGRAGPHGTKRVVTARSKKNAASKPKAIRIQRSATGITQGR